MSRLVSTSGGGLKWEFARDPALCWTGCKDTGRGESLSVIAYNNLTRPLSLHFKKS